MRFVTDHKIDRRCLLLGAVALACSLQSGCGNKPTVQNSGGTVLVYQAAPGVTSQQLEKAGMARLLRMRVDPRRRLQGLSVRVIEKGQIEISIPMQPAADIERIKSRIARSGTLEFLITANITDHDGLIELARQSNSQTVNLDDETVMAKWVRLGKLEEIIENATPIGGLVLRDEKGEAVEIPATLVNANTTDVVNHIRQSNVKSLEALVVYDLNGANFDDRYLASVRLANGYDGKPAIAFSTTKAGGEILSNITSKNLPGPNGLHRSLAIIVDDRLISAPRIQSTIAGEGQISGNFEEDEIDDLITVLQVGRLPFAIQTPPIQENYIQAPFQ